MRVRRGLRSLPPGPYATVSFFFTLLMAAGGAFVFTMAEFDFNAAQAFLVAMPLGMAFGTVSAFFDYRRRKRTHWSRRPLPRPDRPLWRDD